MPSQELPKRPEDADGNAFVVEKGVASIGKFAVGPAEAKAVANSLAEAEEGAVEKAKRKQKKKKKGKDKEEKEAPAPKAPYWSLYRYTI